MVTDGAGAQAKAINNKNGAPSEAPFCELFNRTFARKRHCIITRLRPYSHPLLIVWGTQAIYRLCFSAIPGHTAQLLCTRLRTDEHLSS
jgi:hypothetical protein